MIKRLETHIERDEFYNQLEIIRNMAWGGMCNPQMKLPETRRELVKMLQQELDELHKIAETDDGESGD